VARITKKTWLQEGLKVLTESGIDGLTIEALSTRLSVTKGSFYHHFANRAVYAEELLKFWEAENTLKIKHLANEIEDPLDKIKRLIKLTSDLPHEPEVAVRAWALRDPLARTYQKRVDRMRLAYLEQVHFLLTKDKEKARTGAQLAYTVLVGSQQMVPAIHGKKLQRLFEELVRGLYHHTLPNAEVQSTTVEEL
jgi:AcrR family transcriptional regulator